MFVIGLVLFIVGLIVFWPLCIAGFILIVLGILGSFGKAVLSLAQCCEVAARPRASAAPAAPAPAPGKWQSQSGLTTAKTCAVLLVILALVAAVLAFAGAAHAYKGNELVLDCDSQGRRSISFCYGYVLGVADAGSHKYACVNGVSAGQVREIVMNYMRRHPERWHLDAKLLIEEALKAAFHC